MCAQKTVINPRSRKGKTDGVASRSVWNSGNIRRYCVSQPIAHDQEGVTTLSEPIIHRGLSWASLPKMLLCHANMHRQTHAHKGAHTLNIIKCDKPQAVTAWNAASLEISPRQCYKQVTYLCVGGIETFCVIACLLLCPYFYQREVGRSVCLYVFLII